MSHVTGGTTNPPRRWDLDWLRVLAVLLLVPFHSALIFLLDPGLVAYVKDTVPGAFLVPLKDFLDRWQLELLFYIAGAASWFALSRRSSARYVGERVRRLLLPFVVALFTLIPLMINVRGLGRSAAPSLGQICARFFTLNPADLTGMRGNFTPAHLWFVLYLFVFSLVALPIFRVLRRPTSRHVLSRLALVPGGIYLFVIPLVLARSVDLLGLGAKDPLYYFLVFLFGYVLIGQPHFQESIDRCSWLSFAMAMAATLLPAVLPLGTLSRGPSTLLYRLSQWTWVLVILGTGHRWLNRNSPILRYLSEAAYPFYILHLPVNTLIAFYVVRLSTSIVTKYTLIVVATTLVTLAVYDLVVKRVGPLRFCFGMKPLAPGAHLSGWRRQPAH